MGMDFMYTLIIESLSEIVIPPKASGYFASSAGLRLQAAAITEPSSMQGPPLFHGAAWSPMGLPLLGLALLAPARLGLSRMLNVKRTEAPISFRFDLMILLCPPSPQLHLVREKYKCASGGH